MSCFFLDPSNNSDLFDDEDESFYNDISFDPLVIQPSHKSQNNLNNNNNNNNSIIITNNNFNSPNQFHINHSAQNDSAYFKMNSSNQTRLNSPIEHNTSYDSSNMNLIHGRTVSPAITTKSVNINRTTPLPGAQKRPPHLRLNN